MLSASAAKKERGCFQCSRRRIICDKTEPSCLKCAKKGIDCSGLNRIRFAEGVARRGRFKDFRVPKAEGFDECLQLPTTIGFQELRWADDQRSQKRRKVNADDGVTTNNLAETPLGSFLDSAIDENAVQVFPGPIEAKSSDKEDVGRGHDSVIALRTRTTDISKWISPIDPKARMLFSYCQYLGFFLFLIQAIDRSIVSEFVAPAMVVLDDNSNGYRSLVLPMALEDELLRRAVGVVAAQHLSRQRPELKDAAEAGRAVVISRLRNDSLSLSADIVFNKFTWATLIVLLVGETVTGSPDFPFFVQMLLCLSKNNPEKDLDQGLLAFLQAQTHMYVTKLALFTWKTDIIKV